MMDLLRNCIHNSHVLTGLVLDRGYPVRAVKKAFDKAGSRQLETEHRGLTWYCAQAGISPDGWFIDYLQMQNAAMLSYDYVVGQIGDCHAGLEHNAARVRWAIDYYLKVFRGADELCSHGDFSLANIIFADDQVARIIDWENFNDVMAPEYDLVYLLTELVLFSFAKVKGRCVPGDRLHKKFMLELDASLGLSEGARRAPAAWCRAQAMAYGRLKGVDHNKCPFLVAREETIDALDRALGQ
jgi:aminoglycoside phosphotransferase